MATSGGQLWPGMGAAGGETARGPFRWLLPPFPTALQLPPAEGRLGLRCRNNSFGSSSCTIKLLVRKRCNMLGLSLFLMNFIYVHNKSKC